jgi:Ca-activated chloride channel family protein
VNLTVRSDRRYIRTGYRSNRFLLVEIQAPAAVRRETARPPVNLAFVLDRSGSMSGPKIATAREAVEEAINRLAPEDRFAVVVYDDQIDVVAESALATGEARRRAVDALRRVEARNSTNLGEGWLRGCEQVSRHLAERGVNKALLLTDGLANVGITDASELERHATELRRRGVSTSTFGVGADFDERLLQAMADAGGGHFYFIESAAQIRDHMTSEVGESLEVVARDVKLRLLAPEGVRVESLSRFMTDTQRAPEGTEASLISIGDLVSEQRVNAVLRLNFPYGSIGRGVSVSLGLQDRDGVFGVAGSPTGDAAIGFEYADDRSNDLQPRDRDVDRAVARTFAARVRVEALDLNRRGMFGEAAARLTAVAKKIRDYAGSDGELLRIVAELESDRPVMAAPMTAMASKAAFFASANVQRSRSPQGKAQK